ncbi:MAG: hypothetical protein CL916_02545 [Deltaproteobacteria bacterium]|nr:hypothetical protein [Deltaproteobacteria bacterium]
MSITGIFTTFLYVSNAQAEENNHIPTPIFAHSPSVQTQESMTIERIAGCYGNLNEARSNIRSPKGLVQEPLFHYGSYSAGILDITTPSCILDDNPKGVQPLNMSTMIFEDYLFGLFHCGCAECYIDEENSFPSDEVLNHATEEHKKDYAKYKIQRDKEVVQGKIIHEKYKADYKRWSDIREEKLKNESVRITITPDQDIPEGTLTIYNFHWQVWSWCGDTERVNRLDIQSKGFPHPAVKKGELLTIWLDDANTDLSWGFVLHDKETSSQEIMEQIDGEAQRRYRESLPPEGLPERFKGDVMETEPGRAADIMDECCAC